MCSNPPYRVIWHGGKLKIENMTNNIEKQNNIGYNKEKNPQKSNIALP